MFPTLSQGTVPRPWVLARFTAGISMHRQKMLCKAYRTLLTRQYCGEERRYSVPYLVL